MSNKYEGHRALALDRRLFELLGLEASRVLEELDIDMVLGNVHIADD